jgi:hypothetical protein
VPTPANNFSPGAAVFDAAEPEVHGVIHAVGAEVCEVQFGGGHCRNVPNQYLRVVGADTAVAENPTNNPIVEIITPETPEALVATARETHQRVGEAGVEMLIAAFDAGEALRKLKKLVGHGKFGPCLKRCKIGERTAQVYMRLAEHQPSIASYFAANPQRAAGFSLRVALKLIAKKPSQDEPSQDEPNTESLPEGDSAPEETLVDHWRRSPPIDASRQQSSATGIHGTFSTKRRRNPRRRRRQGHAVSD